MTNPINPSARAPVRLSDIARMAGVSAATVSLVMNDKGNISRATRKRIKKLVAESGYIYDNRAASMRTRRTYNIGVLLQDLVNPYFADFTSGIAASLDATRYTYFLANAEEDPGRQERLLRSFMEAGMDGTILYLSRDTSPDTLNRLRLWGRPTLLAFRRFGREDFDFLGPDHYLGGRMAAEALARAGHRRIVFAGGAAKSANRADRYRGYLDALADAGLTAAKTDNLCMERNTRRDGAALAAKILSSRPKATGALFFNDALALGALGVFRRRGVMPGRDLAVIGFDDIEDAALSMPALCSVSTGPFGIGRRMADMLLRRIDNPDAPVCQQQERPRLVIRETSGCNEENA